MSLTQALMPTTHRLAEILADGSQKVDPTNHKHRVAICLTALEDMIDEEDWTRAQSIAVSLVQEIAMIRRDREANEAGVRKPRRD